MLSLRKRMLWIGLLLLFACDSAGVPRPGEAAPGEGASGESGGTGSGEGAATGGSSQSPADVAPAPYRTSRRDLVQWKRYAAFEADLMGALELAQDQVCVELGDQSCIREAHLVPLGGNEPYVSGLMKPAREPLATTPSVIDRVLLSACSARARRDAEEEPRVFKALDFAAPLPGAEDPVIATTIVALYQRLLARDPRPRELEIVSQLAAPADGASLSAQDFAVLACFAIGTTTEFLFF
jgi:hypothetical protein